MVNIADYYEIDRDTIDGRELVLMESKTDGDEAPAIIVDAKTNEVLMDEVWDGFQDWKDDEARTAQTGRS